MKLTKRCILRMEGLHPDLRRVVYRTAELVGESMADGFGFIVVEGLRSSTRQAALKGAGASQTLNSRHLTGHAVDLACTVFGEIRWDWPLYYRLANLVKEAERIEGIEVDWGGDWQRFKDGPHYELPWRLYPAGAPVRHEGSA